MKRRFQIFIFQAVILVTAMSLILIIYLPWYYGVMAILGVIGATWLVIRLLNWQWQKEEEEENEKIRRENSKPDAAAAPH